MSKNPILGGLISQAGKGVIDLVTKKIDSFITSKEERERLKVELESEFNRHSEKLLELENELSKQYLDDRHSARRREVDTQDWMPKFLGISLIVLFAVSQFMVFFNYLPDNEHARTVISNGVKLIEGAIFLMLGYYFGSTQTADKQKAKL